MPVNYLSLHQWIFNQAAPRDNEQLPIFNAACKPQIASVPLINSKNPAAGVHVDSYQCYSACKMQFALYIRNTFSPDCPDEPKGVKVCLKLLFAQRVDNGGFADFGDNQRAFGVELSINEVIPLIQVLHGRRENYEYNLAKRNESPKSFHIKSQRDPRYPFELMASYGRIRFHTGIEYKDALQLNDIGMSVYRTLNPYNPDALNTVLSLGIAQKALEQPFPSPSQATPKTCTSPIPSEVVGDSDRQVTENQKRALWAVYYNRWDSKNREVIQWVIDTHNYSQVDNIIKMANGGDTDYLDQALKHFRTAPQT